MTQLKDNAGRHQGIYTNQGLPGSMPVRDSMKLGAATDRTGSTPVRDSVKLGTATDRTGLMPVRDGVKLGIATDRTASMPNVLLFGETGNGKSSLINMLAGSEIAATSSDALGCTFGSHPYQLDINGKLYQFWDTSGLNEGEQGTVPVEKALDNLRDLVFNLKDGISLLVYCIRGSRYRDILKVNYDLFSRIICQEKVPVVVVVTGLENESPEMESWWTTNCVELEKYGLVFSGHACVTTSKGKQTKSGEYIFEEEYAQSKDVTQRLIEECCSSKPWSVSNEQWLANITKTIARYYSVHNGVREGSTERVVEDAQWSERTNDAGYAVHILKTLLKMCFGAFRLPADPPNGVRRRESSSTGSQSRRREAGRGFV